jgi:hypothetical protein
MRSANAIASVTLAHCLKKAARKGGFFVVVVVYETGATSHKATHF